MTLYAAALFLHIIGAILLFATLTVEGVGLRDARRAASLEHLRRSAGIAELTRLVGPASGVLILVPGLYMVATTWGWVPWVLIGLATWIFVAVLATVNGIRLASIGRAAGADSNQFSSELAARVRDPLLLASWRLRAALVLGVVFLMTVKPSLVGALLTVAFVAVVGVAASLPAWRTTHSEKQVLT